MDEVTINKESIYEDMFGEYPPKLIAQKFTVTGIKAVEELGT